MQLHILILFCLQLQGCIKVKYTIRGPIIWPEEIIAFLKSKGHEPSSNYSGNGAKVTIQMVLNSL